MVFETGLARSAKSTTYWAGPPCERAWRAAAAVTAEPYPWPRRVVGVKTGPIRDIDATAGCKWAMLTGVPSRVHKKMRLPDWSKWSRKARHLSGAGAKPKAST